MCRSNDLFGGVRGSGLIVSGSFSQLNWFSFIFLIYLFLHEVKFEVTHQLIYWHCWMPKFEINDTLKATYWVMMCFANCSWTDNKFLTVRLCWSIIWRLKHQGTTWSRMDCSILNICILVVAEIGEATQLMCRIYTIKRCVTCVGASRHRRAEYSLCSFFNIHFVSSLPLLFMPIYSVHLQLPVTQKFAYQWRRFSVLVTL